MLRDVAIAPRPKNAPTGTAQQPHAVLTLALAGYGSSAKSGGSGQ